jgi:EAL domain-containing protein (putative c-di-GMP-specific phosphodiesterase class I)
VTLPAGRIVGFEAFARWKHKELGPIPPAEFIPLAEETGLVGQLDRQVLEEACATLRELHRSWPRTPPLTLSVNLSGRELLKPDLVPEVERIISASGLEPRLVSLEITEAVLVDNEEQARRSLDGLRRLGLRVCLDDFGTGCSSLGSLHRLPLDGLKVHGSFVDSMVADRHDLRVVESLVLLGHNLGLEVIAEGVERDEQARELTRMGCDRAQGFLFGSPLDRNAAAAALTAESLLPPPGKIYS